MKIDDTEFQSTLFAFIYGFPFWRKYLFYFYHVCFKWSKHQLIIYYHYIIIIMHNNLVVTYIISKRNHIISKITNNYVEYKGKSKFLPLHFSICSYCETEQADQQQSVENKRVMDAFKKVVDETLTGDY